MDQLPNNLIEVELIDLTDGQKYRLSILLGKRKTFFITYFNNLPYSRTNTECFNKLNDLHFEIFGEYMYSDIFSFTNQLNRRNG